MKFILERWEPKQWMRLSCGRLPQLNKTEVAIGKLKNNKHPGQDNLFAELMKQLLISIYMI